MQFRYVRWFRDIGLDDLPTLGAKNASLGELYSALWTAGIKVPNGFAITAQAYHDALEAADALPQLRQLLEGLDKRHSKTFAARATEARGIVHAALDLPGLREEIVTAYRQLEREYGRSVAIAVRTSSTGYDPSHMSPGGDNYLNIQGADALVEACRRCFASIFADSILTYRVEKGLDHFGSAMSVGVMKMIRCDLATSGTILSLDAKSGFREVFHITAAFGLGGKAAEHTTEPDEFYVHKPTFREGRRAVLSRSLGRKQTRVVPGRGLERASRQVSTPKRDRERFCIDDADVLRLARYAVAIEDHYSRKADRPVPMNIEWAKDGPDGELFILQAQPEHVSTRQDAEAIEPDVRESKGRVLPSGHARFDELPRPRTAI